MRRIAAAGMLAGTTALLSVLCGGVAFAADPPGNDNSNVAPWQICGSNVPIVGGLAALGSGATAGNCTNAYVPGASGSDSNSNVLPWQICGSNVPIVGLGVPVASPAQAGNCTNASVN